MRERQGARVNPSFTSARGDGAFPPNDRSVTPEMPERPTLPEPLARAIEFLVSVWKGRRWTYRPERYYMRGKPSDRARG